MIRGFFGCIKKNVDRFVIGDWGWFYFDDEQEVQLMSRSTEVQSDLLHINGTIRLDYRDELGDKLGIRYADLLATSDDELVKQAYHKWGADLVFHLEGDWSIAVFDSEKQQLLLAKEPSGISAIFYLEHEGAIYFASDTRVLSRLKNRNRILNESYLKSLEEPLYGFLPHQTADRDIRYLMCGERMLFDQAEMRCEVYTDLLSQPAKLSYRYAVDQVLQFRSVFAESVRQRIDFNKKTGIFLSGGLDSGSVGALLAMEFQCKQQQFDAYTSVPAYPDELSESVRTIADESPVVRHLVDAYGSIIPHAVDFKGDAVITNHIEKRIEDCFYPVITKNTYWINGILKQAYEAGVSRMMQAQTGNYIISWNAPQRILTELMQGDWKRAARELKCMTHAAGMNLMRLLWREVIRPIIKSWVRRRGVPMNSRLLRIEMLKRNLTFTGMRWYLDGLLFGMNIVEPTSDQRLIRHSLMVPEWLFNYDGEQKYILRAAMKGILPDAIRNSTRIFFQSCDFMSHLDRDEGLKKILARTHMKNINPNRIREELVTLSLELFKSQKKN